MKASPTIGTQLSASTITAGGSAHDTATLTGATATAGGTVIYSVYTDSTCSTLASSALQPSPATVSVTNGVVPNSAAVSFPTAGTYYWQAAYSGDSTNNLATSPCTSETLAVTTAGKSAPTISTELSASSISAGGSVHDSATLAGAHSGAGGTVTYNVYTDTKCSIPAGATQPSPSSVTVTNGVVPNSANVSFPTAGTYYWQAVYSGDSNDYAAVSPCTSEALVVTGSTSGGGKRSPRLVTRLSETRTEIGSRVRDDAALIGAGWDASGTVTYTVYSDSSCSDRVASAGTARVGRGGIDGSNWVYFDRAGTYYWQASYSGDARNNPATSECGSEVLVVTAPFTPPPHGRGHGDDGSGGDRDTTKHSTLKHATITHATTGKLTSRGTKHGGK